MIKLVEIWLNEKLVSFKFFEGPSTIWAITFVPQAESSGTFFWGRSMP